MIKDEFSTALAHYTDDTQVKATLWAEIETSYRQSGRYYHTLVHLEAMLQELVPFQSRIGNWDSFVFALAYHDMVYKILKSDNEERSAILATRRLLPLGLAKETMEAIQRLIMATKKHQPVDAETNLFIDADLSILGAPADQYENYRSQIRQEYNIYPDLIYNSGRKKVLQQFLAMERIYKTEEFAGRLEANARQNILNEITRLN